MHDDEVAANVTPGIKRGNVARVEVQRVNAGFPFGEEENSIVAEFISICRSSPVSVL